MRYAQPSPFPFILTLILIIMFPVTAVNITYELGIYSPLFHKQHWSNVNSSDSYLGYAYFKSQSRHWLSCGFCGFPKSFQAIVRIESQTKSSSLPHPFHLFITLLFEGLYSELLKASSYKPQNKKHNQFSLGSSTIGGRGGVNVLLLHYFELTSNISLA
jgi:glucan phosphoethanolaminetransferase (alkaline phosphatase superfamily)